jgi:hypothetical protein
LGNCNCQKKEEIQELKRRIEKKKKEDQLENEIKSKNKLNSIEYLKNKELEMDKEKTQKIQKIGISTNAC